MPASVLNNITYNLKYFIITLHDDFFFNILLKNSKKELITARLYLFNISQHIYLFIYNF